MFLGPDVVVLLELVDFVADALEVLDIDRLLYHGLRLQDVVDLLLVVLQL